VAIPVGEVQVAIVDFDTEQTAIRRIRFGVFVDEQKVPASLEMDERDARCVHVLAFLGGEPVGTGRIDLVPRAEGDASDASDRTGQSGRAGEIGGKIGRVAVLSGARGRGVGSALMQSLHAVAVENDLTQVWCNAQVAAVPFYDRLGYRVVSGRFAEAGIEHVRMVKDLRAGRIFS
jgi:predicted GNAT family N-acyltransferase